MKIAVVYWSGTGHTETMAKAVAESCGGTLFTAAEFAAERTPEFDAIAFGCPAMGAEVLEESEFQPMFDECAPLLSGKRIALFGSYGWGDGEWMRSWEAECLSMGATLVCGSVICQDEPDEPALTECKKLGQALAS